MTDLCGAPAGRWTCGLPLDHEGDHVPEYAIDTGADWRGTPFRAGALACWVVGNDRAVEGEVISWERDTVTVRPLRRSYRVVGGVAKGEDHPTPRPQTIDRIKVTILRPQALPTIKENSHGR
jgi:hypothetical protein